MQLHKNRILRRIVLPMLERFSPGDISIRHHFTDEKLRIHCYRHKGYWFHGKRREAESMDLFGRFIAQGSTVLDVGGHVGYVAMYLAELVGPDGKVVVFEPGKNNLPYLRRNAGEKENVTVVEKGVGARPERRSFFLENLTGQNNSFVDDFDVLETNKARAYASQTKVEETTVDVVTLDDFCGARQMRPDFIKIDVEGFEREVLLGAERLLREVRPMLMVEIQAGHADIVRLARKLGYLLFTPDGQAIGGADDFHAQHINTFWLHEQAHARQKSQWLDGRTARAEEK